MNGTFLNNNYVVTNGVTLSVATLASVPPGIWILTFNSQVYPVTTVTTSNISGVRYNVSTAINTFVAGILNVSTEGTNYSVVSALPTFNGTTCLTITTTTTYYLNVTITFNSGDVRLTDTCAFFRAVRIG